MKNVRVMLEPLLLEDREQFILDNQWAFKYGAMMEFGERDSHIDGDGEIISRATIEQCIDAPDREVYRIVTDGRKVGGVILRIDKITHHNELEILFVLPEEHSKGVGYGAWCAVEKLHPETIVWETCTPYFEKRNIHFYVNKCGFKIDQFWCEYFTPEHEACGDDNSKVGERSAEERPDGRERCDDDKLGDRECRADEGPDEMFRFVKYMR